MRYVLIDKITELEPGRTLKGIKNATFSEGLNDSGGANSPALSAAFVLEAMAQAAGLLVAATIEYHAQPVLAKVQRMRVYERAAAGDRIEISAALEDLNDAGAKVYVHARVEQIPIAEGTVFLSLISIADFTESEFARARRRGELLARLGDSFPGWFAGAPRAEAML